MPERRFFLVERYVPSMRAPEIGAAVARLEPTGHLWTVLIPGEDTCLSLFEAPEQEAVAASNELARFPFDRIVEVRLVGGPTGEAGQTTRLGHIRAKSQ